MVVPRGKPGMKCKPKVINIRQTGEAEQKSFAGFS